MTMKACLLANTLHFTKGGGHFWAYLNWALGLKANGCNVVWLERVRRETSEEELIEQVKAVKTYIDAYHLGADIVLYASDGRTFRRQTDYYSGPEVLDDTDILLNMSYGAIPEDGSKFRKKVLLDIDPGLTQNWVKQDKFALDVHDRYFTIGEHIGKNPTLVPDLGLTWIHTPPCVSLDQWPVTPSCDTAPFTTVSNWYSSEYVIDHEGGWYSNNKRSGFFPFLELPRYTKQPLELSLGLFGDVAERENLTSKGWLVRESSDVAATPWSYQEYVQHSRGEFSCAKPSYSIYQNAWISDRTLCYLASGKPAVVKHTGPSSYLPEASGLFRFNTLEEAAKYLHTIENHYEEHCHAARALAETHFDAKQVIRNMLEIVI